MKTQAGALLSSIHIDRESPRTISVQLYMALRDILLSGGLKPGERLPASRTLAQELGVSRTTVIDAVDRLVSEGLLTSQVGSGTFVSEALEGQARLSIRDQTPSGPAVKPRLSHAARHADRQFAPRAWLAHEQRSFITGMPALDAFPMAHWARLSARHWRGARSDVMGYPHPVGSLSLRQAIATHLNASRGIRCEADQIFIVSGAQQAFSLIGSVLLNPGDQVWFENPGATGARNAFVAGGAQLVPVAIDESGLSVSDGLRRAPHFRLAFVTPSHQQPLGHVMPLDRRLELLQAAEDADALIVEDDYDGEFHFGGQPQPPLKSIDTQGRVVYVGTFSKSLFPALRLGFILAPDGLVDIFTRIFSSWMSGVPNVTQAVVAEFMNEGHFATHIRAMRRIYHERYEALREATSTLAGFIDLHPTSSGLHTMGDLPPELEEADVVAAAAERGVILAPLGRYCLEPLDRKGLVLGYGSVPPEEIQRGAQVLAQLG